MSCMYKSVRPRGVLEPGLPLVDTGDLLAFVINSLCVMSVGEHMNNEATSSLKETVLSFLLLLESSAKDYPVKDVSEGKRES